MDHLSRFTAAAFIVCIFGASCSKEPENALTGTAGAALAKDGGADCIEGVEVECGMLSFSSQQEFTEVYDCLEAEYEAHLDDFEATYGHLSEDEYNDTSDALGFVDEQPLIDFENALSFVSARRTLADAEDLYLGTGAHPNESPMLNSPFDDDILAAMFNANYAVMIDGVIYAIDENGEQWSFCDCDTYLEWLSDPGSVDPEDECSLLLKGGTVDYPDCKSDWWQYCWHEYDPGNKNVNWKLQVRYWHFWDHSSATAEIWHYKKKNGSWKSRKADLLARSHGRYNGADECVILDDYMLTKAKKRKHLSARYVQIVQIASYLDLEAKGYWEYPSSNYVNMALDFTLSHPGEDCPF